MHLEKHLRKHNDPFEISLVNRENYFVFQPMLAQVVGGSLDLLDTINPLRKLLPKTELFIREIDSIDIEKKCVLLTPKYSHVPTQLCYDHLVLALGNVTDFRGITGLHEHSLPFKTLADSISIRNQVIEVLEAAASEKDPELEKKLLTFVVGGGGFSGTGVVAEINDMVHKLAKQYPRIDNSKIRVVFVHNRDRLMETSISEPLSRYAEKLLRKRGIEIRFDVSLSSATPEEAVLDTGEKIYAKTIISTVPASPNPLIEHLPLRFENDRVVTDAQMQVEGHSDLWAIGDCAAIPNIEGKGTCPPNALFATREAKVLAHNLIASIGGKEKKEFRFKALGIMGGLGHHSAVAEFFGKYKFSGFGAWLLWRWLYWLKLPGINRKFKVALTWILDTLIPLEAVQIKMTPTQGIAELHFESGEVIFNEGDMGDYLYIIMEGEVEVYTTKDGKEKVLAKLGKGEYFGEMALLKKQPRNASIRCLSPVNVLALRKNDFGILISNFKELKKEIEHTEETRNKKIG